MAKHYSRLNKTEERKNLRKSFLYIVLAMGLLVALFFYGIPAMAKFAAFLSELNKSNEPIGKSDTTPPILPTLDELVEATNEKDLDISGSTEPGATVTLFLNNKKKEVLANSEGEFIYDFSLVDGVNTIAAMAVDGSGNESQKTDTKRVIFDDEPPELEVAKPDNNSEYYGSKQRQVVIEGKTEQNVNVSINERLVVVDNDGSFTFFTSLSEGENKFTIKAVDNAGNESEALLILQFSS